MAYTINKRKNNDHWKVTQWHLRGSHNEFWGEHMMILEGFTQWPWDDPGRIDTKTLERYTQWPWKDTQRPRKGASIDPSEVNPGLIHMTTLEKCKWWSFKDASDKLHGCTQWPWKGEQDDPCRPWGNCSSLEKKMLVFYLFFLKIKKPCEDLPKRVWRTSKQFQS